MRAAKIIGVISNLILIAVIVLCMPVAVPRIMGYQSYHIISGSMEPAIPVGSLVYVKKTSPESVQAGDIIAYRSGADASGVITHRVTANNVEAQNFITKGDANAAEDLSPVRYSSLLGRVTTIVPRLGVLCAAVSTFSGRMTLAALVALAVVLRLMAILFHAMAEERGTGSRAAGRRSMPVIFLAAGAVLVLGAGGFLLLTRASYNRSNSLYDQINREYVSDYVTGTSSGEENNDSEAPDWNVCAAVDFTGLKALNSDIVGWLCFENEDISYPILYSGEDSTYLRTGADGRRAVAGSIFMEGKNTPDFSDSHTIIYGHNMRNLSMFGKLRYYYSDEAYYAKHAYFQILTEEKAYRYQIFAYEHVSQDSAVYAVPFAPDEEFQSFVDSLYRLSMRDTGVTATKDDLIVTLSTCSTTGNRFVVHAVRVGEQNIGQT